MTDEEVTPEEILAEFPPVYLGPSWRRDENGDFELPEYTLGWQILGWCYEYLNNFDGTPHLVLTDEQARIILWWYAIDETGEFINRKGVIQRSKGHGKDPLLAVISTVEFLGPSRFGGWDGDEPVGISHPNAWVQISAVNQAQTTNTSSLFATIFSDNLIRTYGIKMGAELIRANNGRKRLEMVTSSFRAIEGKRTTFSLLNETQHWVTGNDGIKMYETIDGNASKMDSRYLAITNAFMPGEDSVAEKMRDTYEKIQEGRAVDFGFMYDSIEAHSATPLDPPVLRVILPLVYGDAHWINIETLILSILDITIGPARSRRMYLNQIVAEEDAVLSPGDWDAIADADAILKPGDKIVLGFDGSKSDDSTALVAIRISDRTAFLLCLEEKPEGPRGENWEVNKERVDSVVRHAFNTYDVKAFYADVAYWESHIDSWAEDYRETLIQKATERHAVAWDMRTSLQKVTRAHERLLQAVIDGSLKHDGDLRLKRHAMNARRRENVYGVSFSKETRESPKKVDAYAALMIAHEALTDYRTRGKKEKVRTGNAYFF